MVFCIVNAYVTAEIHEVCVLCLTAPSYELYDDRFLRRVIKMQLREGGDLKESDPEDAYP